jgi:hypothetical protein
LLRSGPGLRVILIFCFLKGFFPQLSLAADPVGIYGVNRDAAELFHYKISKVFLPPDEKLIMEEVTAGREVFLTLNVFGGSEAWKIFPDARPVKADGTFLKASLGGICPTHEGWRQERLDLLSSWLEKFSGESAISGVWLDFIRYPGRWEQEAPDIPDTCYCDRCLLKFQTGTGIHIAKKATNTAAKAKWIQENAALQWMEWKKEQIASFVRDARKRIEQHSKRKVKLGVFLVPWRKSDFEGALSFRLAQDPKLLASFVNVFSPMVYHRMVDRPVSWVGEITDYVAEMTGREVWPIIQAEKVGAQEFALVVQTVSRSRASGLLIYTFSELQEEHWPILEKFSLPENLLQNPGFGLGEVPGVGNQPTQGALPEHWHSAPAVKVQGSTFLFEAMDGGNAIGLTAGYDRQAVWSSALPACRPGKSYLFSADFLRPDCRDGAAYPEISLWGKKYRLNTHRMTGKFQRLKTLVTCPEESGEAVFQFHNDYPGNTFWMRAPELVEKALTKQVPQAPPDSGFFPIGTYGASSANLAEIQALGLNTAVVGLNKENIEACLSLALHCTLTVPHEPEKLIHALNTLQPFLTKGHFSFYVNDEPGIYSFPQGQAEDIQTIIKQHFPQTATNMAIVRPQVIPFYAKGADYFMLDQYPVPNMPMTWLSDSMDEGAQFVGRDRLQSVIQAFGDDALAAGGWPRLPSFEEMSCLAFLSVIHGSRGIYFFTYPSITATKQGKKDFSHLVHRLNSMQSWLQVHNDKDHVVLRMTSEYRFDPRGNPAVHCARKEQYSRQMLVCVNTLHTYTEAEIDIPAKRQSHWLDFFTAQPYLVANGNILARFAPYEAKVLLESK